MAHEAALVRRRGRSRGVDGQAPDPLDEAQQSSPCLLGDDLAEQRAEQLDLARERVARARRADARGLGADRGIRRRGRALIHAASRSTSGWIDAGGPGHPVRLAGSPSRAAFGSRSGAVARLALVSSRSAFGSRPWPRCRRARPRSGRAALPRCRRARPRSGRAALPRCRRARPRSYHSRIRHIRGPSGRSRHWEWRGSSRRAADVPGVESAPVRRAKSKLCHWGEHGARQAKRASHATGRTWRSLAGRSRAMPMGSRGQDPWTLPGAAYGSVGLGCRPVAHDLAAIDADDVAGHPVRARASPARRARRRRPRAASYDRSGCAS